MPDEVEIKKAPKQWIVNMIYSLVQDDFADWVKRKINTRNEKVTSDRNLLIDMDPDVAAAFASSTAVSSKCLDSI